MTRTILVPLDGSAFAERVLPQAIAQARISGAELALLRVATPLEANQSLLRRSTIPAYLQNEWEDSMLAQAQLYLSDVARRLKARDLRVRTEVLLEQDPAAVIVARAQQDRGIGLVAMATHGHGGLSRWALGSVAAKVLPAASTPILLLRPREDSEPLAAEAAYRTIVVPLDGSEIAELALPQAQLIAGTAGAEVVLLTVVSSGASELAEMERTQARAYLAHIELRFRAEGLQVRSRLVAGTAAEQILQISGEEGADLIVMATHGRGGWQSLWLGSVANKIAQSAELPVLLLCARNIVALADR